MRIKKEVVIFLIFFLAGILSRGLFASKDFTHMDGVLYAISTFRYSIQDNMPPAPGYFLYIMSAKLLNIFTGEPHTSLMWLSIFYSGLIAGALYYFGTLLKDRMTGVISAILFLTSPLFWYKGITIFGYLNSGFFIILTALLGFKVVVEKKAKLIIWASICFAILVGIRPQELFVLLPLYAFVLFHVRPKAALSALLVFFIVFLGWFMPLVSMSGGISAYLSAVKSGSLYLVEDSIVGGSLISQINNHLVRMGRYFEWAYFLGIIPLVYYIGRFFYLPALAKDKKVQFFVIWLLPTVLYNIFIQFGEIGHGMSWGLGLLLILGESVVILCEDILKALRRPNWKWATYTFVLGPIVLINLVMFFYDFDKGGADFYSFEKYRQFNYKDVVNHNHFQMSKINFIKENFKPESLLIISSGAFSYQVMYHLPEAIVIQPNIIYKKDNYGFSLFNRFRRSYFRHKVDFIVPNGITKLILFDDIFIPYFQGKRDVTYHKAGDYKLLAYDVSPKQRIVFENYTIRID